MTLAPLPLVRRGLVLVSFVALGASVAGACGSDNPQRKVRAAGGEGGTSNESGGTSSEPEGTAGASPADGGVGNGASSGGQGAAGTAAEGGAGGETEPGTPGGAGGATSEGGAGGATSEGGEGGTAPSGPLRAYSVTSGFYSSFVVELGTRDVWAWGYQVDGATGGFDAANSAGWATKPVRVQGLTDVEYVVAVSEVSAFYALHTDGTVSAWGYNGVGQLGDQTTTTRALPVKVLDVDGSVMRGVCSIAAAANLLLMARAPDCSTYEVGMEPPNTIIGAWAVGLFTSTTIGGSDAPAIPFDGAIARKFPGLPADVRISSIAMNDAAASSQAGAVFFMDNGDRYAWGYNATNRLGAGGSTPFAGDANTAANVTAFWTTSTRAELGRESSVALTNTASLVSVGRNVEGQLGNGNETGQTTLVPVLNLTNVTNFTLGQVSAVAITGGQLWAWGWNGYGPVTTPTRLGALDGFTRVSFGDEHGLAIGTDSRIYVWGGRAYGALGDGLSSGRAATPALLAE